jgi:hypothetical protein
VWTCTTPLATSGPAGVYLLVAASIATVVLGAAFVELLRLVRHMRLSAGSEGDEVALR